MKKSRTRRLGRTRIGGVALVIALVVGLAAVSASAAPSALQPQANTLGVQPNPPPQAFGLKPTTGLGAAPTPPMQSQSQSQPQLPLRAGAASSKPAVAAGTALFEMEDRAIIIVGGKPATAGDLQRALKARITAAAGPPKTVAGGARRLDLAALDVRKAADPRAAPLPTRDNPKTGGSKTSSSLQVGATVLQVAPVRGSGAALVNKPARSLAEMRCPDKGLPLITELAGKLRPGAKFSIWGQCLGDRPGRVEIIGQFPGGVLVVPFTAWDMIGIDVAMPADISRAADHAVAVTVVTADNQRTPAVQGRFVAARERIDVPDRLWSPGAGFELAATTQSSRNQDADLFNGGAVNKATAGQTAKSLRIHAQCTLDSMDAVVQSGGITRIQGWEQGPPNEATVTIDWVGTCVDTKTTKTVEYIVGIDHNVSVSSACRVAFQARATAYCPVGVAP